MAEQSLSGASWVSRTKTHILCMPNRVPRVLRLFGQQIGTRKDSGELEFYSLTAQSCTQSPQALWPAVGRQERLWGTGILLPQNFCSKTMEAVMELIQSRTQSPQALWPAVGHQERLWGTGNFVTAGFLTRTSFFQVRLTIIFRTDGCK